MWDYKTDYYVFWMGIQLAGRHRNLANNDHAEKHSQRDCEERLGDEYVVQISDNIFRYSNVLVYFIFRKSGKEQGIGRWVWNDVSGVCGEHIPNVELI